MSSVTNQYNKIFKNPNTIKRWISSTIRIYSLLVAVTLSWLDSPSGAPSTVDRVIIPMCMRSHRGFHKKKIISIKSYSRSAILLTWHGFHESICRSCQIVFTYLLFCTTFGGSSDNSIVYQRGFIKNLMSIKSYGISAVLLTWQDRH